MQYLDYIGILGTARNCNKYLPKTLINITLLLQLFPNSKCVIFENDSLDCTLETLKGWSLSSSKSS